MQIVLELVMLYCQYIVKKNSSVPGARVPSKKGRDMQFYMQLVVSLGILTYTEV